MNPSGMDDFFSGLGRRLGRAAVPVFRKSKWLWQSVAGSEAESIQAETDFGKALAAELRLRMGEGADPGDTELVSGIGQRLASVVENKLRRFHVEVIRSDGPAAMALPGGFIFVGAPLLDLCERQPDELAFAVGHEMAHVIQGHAFQRIVRSVGMEVISFLLSRGTLNPWLRQSGLKLLQSAHSRDSELEADALGVRLAKEAGYDPRGSLRLLQRLETLPQTAEGIGNYFAAHPPAAVRIAHLTQGKSERNKP